MNRRASNRVVESSILLGVAGVLFFLAASTTVGWEIKGRPQGDVASPSLSTPSISHDGPQLAAPVKILAVRRFHHNVRQPRAPRHRSERPSNFSVGKDLTAASIYLITHDDMHRPLQTDAVAASPLSGHPLELLRPPSVCA